MNDHQNERDPEAHEIISSLRAQLAEANKRSEHWKANHDQQVSIKQRLSDDYGVVLSHARTLAAKVKAAHEYISWLEDSMGVPKGENAFKMLYEATDALGLVKKYTQGGGQ